MFIGIAPGHQRDDEQLSRSSELGLLSIAPIISWTGFI
jgi:hypothetical protein